MARRVAQPARRRSGGRHLGARPHHLTWGAARLLVLLAAVAAAGAGVAPDARTTPTTAPGSSAALPIDATSAGEDAAATAADPEARTDVELLTLERAVRIALEGNRPLDAATKQVERAEEMIGSAKARRLPSLSVEASPSKLLTDIELVVSEGDLGTFPGIGPVPARDETLSSSSDVVTIVSGSIAQPLTQLHEIGLGIRSRELGRDLERERLREQRQQVAHQVASAYHALVAARGALAAAQERLEASREAERLAERNLAERTQLRSQALQAKARRAEEERHVLDLSNDVAGRKEQLNLLLGRDLGVDFDVEPPAPPPADGPPEDLEAERRALEGRPDLRQARLQIDLAEADLRIKRAEYVPDLSFGLTYNSFFNTELLPRNVAVLGLQMSWEPFDWGRRGREVSDKVLAVEQARAAAREAEERARADVRACARRLREARLASEAAGLAAEASEEALRETQERRREEASLHADVLQAAAALADARARSAQADGAYWVAWSDLQRAMGVDP